VLALAQQGVRTRRGCERSSGGGSGRRSLLPSPPARAKTATASCRTYLATAGAGSRAPRRASRCSTSNELGRHVEYLATTLSRYILYIHTRYIYDISIYLLYTAVDAGGGGFGFVFLYFPLRSLDFRDALARPRVTALLFPAGTPPSSSLHLAYPATCRSPADRRPSAHRSDIRSLFGGWGGGAWVAFYGGGGGRAPAGGGGGGGGSLDSI